MSFVELNSETLPPLKQALVMALVYSVGVPFTKFLEVTGMYSHFSRKVRGKVYADILNNSFDDYQPSKHDVLVCTYPKSGTNWMMQMAYQIAFQGQGDFGHIHDVIPWPDAIRQTIPATLQDNSIVEASPTGLRVIKTHLAWNNIPYSSEARYICIVRDPKDVFNSSYFFVGDVLFGPMMPSVKAWHESFLAEDAFVFGSWATHIHSSWQVRELENVLFLSFEQMKTDQPAIIRQVADFMGVELTPEAFKLVDEKSHFRYMKSIGHKFDPPQIMPWSSANTKMLRKGESGGSSELLTQEQQRQIDDYCRAALLKLGSDFPYDEFYGSA